MIMYFFCCAMKYNYLTKSALCCLLLVSLNSIAQTQADYKLPSVVQPSHNAISLGRFGDVPVTYYNGMPQVSIPLMPLETATGFKLPLSLNYYPGGVKLNDMPSMVGMNWALSAGGAITRTIRGGEDFGAFGSNFPDAFHDGYYFTNERPTDAPDCLFRAKASTGVYDVEPDNFFYNIPGGSGKFNFTEQRVIEQFPEKNMFIEVTNGPSKGQTPEWRITDAANNQYYFLDNEVEFTEVTNSNTIIYGGAFGIPGSLSSTPEAATSFWLSRIKPANGNAAEEINFTYLSYDAEYVTHKGGAHSIGISGACLNDMMGSLTISTNMSSIKGRFKHLQHIIYKNYDIEFIYIDAGIPSGIKALKEIKYKHNNVLYRHLVFDYLVEADKDRFWLTKVTDLDVTTGATTNNYQLSYYNQSLLPARLSGYNDVFGYFNNNQHPFRAPRLLSLPNGNPLHPAYENANPIVDMTADPVKTTYGMLTKIIYPTKGYTEFTFEAHDYNFNLVSGVGGGVRIKEIKNFEKQGTTAFTIKQFEYEGGKLMAEPNSYYLASSLSNPADYCIKVVSSTTGNVSLSNSAMGSTVGYDKVVVRNKSNTNVNADNGRTEYTYWNQTDLPPTILTQIWAVMNYLLTYRFPPSTPFTNTQSWSNGFLLKEAHYHANGNITLETDYVRDASMPAMSKVYTFYTGPASSYGGIFNVNDICTHISTIQYTRVHPGAARPSSKTTKTYNLINGVPTADFMTTTETYTYDKLLPYETTITNSKNQTIRKQQVWRNTIYPYFLPNVPISERTWKDFLDTELTLYNYLNANTSLPEEVSYTELSPLGNSAGNVTPLANTTKVNYQYNADNQLIGATPYKSPAMAYLWDDDLGKVMAIASNVAAPNMAFTSFENSLAKGRFVFNTSGIVADARTGLKGFNLSNSNTLSTSLTNAGKYKVSFWVKTNFTNPNVLVANGSVLSNFEETYAGFGWKLMVYTIELYAASIVEIRGTGVIDEVQVIPTNATIKTYTHHPFFGPLSETDEKNTLKTFGYDAFGRLNVIKDHKGAVLNLVKYNLR